MNQYTTKLKGVQRQTVEVEVSYDEMFKVIKRAVLKSIGLHRGQWIEDDKIYQEQHTSHSWTDYVGPATQKQVEVYNALSLIKQSLRAESVL